MEWQVFGMLAEGADAMTNQITRVFSAQGFGANDDPPGVTIQIRVPIPTESLSLTRARELFDREGELLFSALIDNLPQGTIDALLVRLLKQRASLLCVKVKN